MSRPVYINATGTFLPNPPVDNENIERVLGMVGNRPSRSRSPVLASNQILTRHYAMNPETREPTHSNASMTALAIRDLFEKSSSLNLSDVHLLCVGTSSPDLLFPAHGQMVQGELAEFTGEVITNAGVCCSSASALKSAYLSVLSGDTDAALVTGSEAASKWMRSEFFESEDEAKVDALKKNSMVAFEHDFLRWMLSDGAGAVYLSDKTVPGKTNLRINWIEGRSYANEQAVCMMAGGLRSKENEVLAWRDLRLAPDAQSHKHVMNASQDIRQLRASVPIYTVKRPLQELKKKRGLRPGDYKWFVPHFSSHFFREILADTLREIDFDIPQDRWFTALSEVGNIGSASMFVFLDKLLQKEKLQPGEKILCYVPESSRFSVYYFELEVV